MKCVLFLDIDGVLNSHLTEIRNEEFFIKGMAFSPTLIQNFKKVVQAFNPEIVILSDWRNSLSEADLQEVFLGLLGVSVSVAEPMISKSVAIEKWTLQRPGNFALIDDDRIFDLDHPFYSHQFKTGLYKGLDATETENFLKFLEDLWMN